MFLFRMYHGEAFALEEFFTGTFVLFITALYSRTLLSRLNLEFLFKCQFKFAAFICMLVILRGICFLHLSLLSKCQPSQDRLHHLPVLLRYYLF